MDSRPGYHGPTGRACSLTRMSTRDITGKNYRSMRTLMPARCLDQVPAVDARRAEPQPGRLVAVLSHKQ